MSRFPVGICNPSTLCYAISVIQQVFMVPNFRFLVLDSSGVSALGDIFNELSSPIDRQYIDISSHLCNLSKEFELNIDIVDSKQGDACDFLANRLEM